MLKKIDFFLPDSSQYQVLNHFTTKLYDAFVRQGKGISCRLLGGEMRRLVPIEDPPDLTIAFNGIFKDSQGSFFCDVIKVPHLACLIDPPYHFSSLLKSPYVIVTCDDRFCCEFLGQRHFSRVFFMPHATEPEIAWKKKQKRIYEVVLLATYIDCNFYQKKWKEQFPADVYKAMNEAIEMTFADQHTSFMHAFEVSFDYWMKKPSDSSKIDFTEILQDLEMYIKGREHQDLLRAIRDVPIHVFDSAVGQKGWDSFINKEKLHHVTWHAGVSYAQALEIMRTSKIVLNSSIKNKSGAHERIFAALASGAIVATSENEYLKETFQEQEGILFYKNAEIGKINEVIHEYLSDEPKRQKSAFIGQEIVLKHHTWDERVKCLLKELPPILERYY